MRVKKIERAGQVGLNYLLLHPTCRITRSSLKSLTFNHFYNYKLE